MKKLVPATKDNLIVGRVIRVCEQLTKAKFTYTGIIKQVAGKEIRFTISEVEKDPKEASIPEERKPGTLLGCTLDDVLDIEIEVEEELEARSVTQPTERERNIQQFNQRMAAEIRDQLQVALREGRSLDVFLLRRDLGNYSARR